MTLVNKNSSILILTILTVAMIFVFFSFQTDEQATTTEINNHEPMDDWGYYNLAISSLDYNNCPHIISMISRNICYEQIANSTEDESICDLITTETKKNSCHQTTKLKKIKKSSDISKCETITDDMLIVTCMKKLIDNHDNVDCSLVIDEKMRNYCETENYYNKAIENKDIELCKIINTGTVRANCFSMIEGKDLFSDEDNDGLNYKDEIIYGTDPKVSDSDSDNYLDGTEVEKGFNPTGDGMIDTKNYNKISCIDIENSYTKYLCFLNNPDGFLILKNCNFLLGAIELYELCLENI